MNSIVMNMLSNLSSEELLQIRNIVTNIIERRVAGRVVPELPFPYTTDSASGHRSAVLAELPDKIAPKLPDKIAPKLPDKILPSKLSDPKLLSKLTPPKLFK